MPSLREEFQVIQGRLDELGLQDRSVDVYESIADQLRKVDNKLQHAMLPPDERVELGKLSAQTHGQLDRQLHDLQYPTILSPQPPEQPERGWGFDGFDRGR